MTQLVTVATKGPAASTAGGAVAAFDRMAASYDATFTESQIGRAQRNVVWNVLRRAFRAGDRVLELNCGTGEDAAFLSRRGVSVVACDGSERMIEVARCRKAELVPRAAIEFRVLRSEDLHLLRAPARFDGVLSNFSGLNCVADLREVAANLNRLVRANGVAILCLSTRVCLWEIAWHCAQGNFTKAFRRTSGQAIAHVEGISVPVWYPTLGQLRRLFSPWFRVRSVQAVGLFVPPSYVEGAARRHRRLLSAAQTLDQVAAGWPMLRGLGDHVLLELERAGTVAATIPIPHPAIAWGAPVR